ncbi:DUF1049 domain-containing protein [Dactylosporangium vinaceum]|uniref:Lipopolysaccharide assembly protein LapA domain-containing protein n=1 Tax=Dactylosporangium vinaceum TaxID=53362 RepID=A0ABV5MSL2_9ACTN|nr:lipopolysaccharide assembly protein LapA domain-containing protein [Dactylosporangium vinaceum]UAC00150.1 DUF1049 domain-containing protein [Dactylosporangium vinaceum]
MTTTSPPPLGPSSDPAAAPQPATDPAGKPRGDRDPRTRTGTTWFGICVAAVLLVVLIVFMLQNTGSVEVTFLGMHGNLPLAMALLVAAVGAAIVTMAIGAARIVQIRRQSRHRQP